MAQVVIDAMIVYALLGATAISVIGIVMLLLKFWKSAPEAFLLMRARSKRMPLIFMHYPNNVVKLHYPKLEKGVENIANYYSVDNGNYKFWDASGQNYEKLNGDITLYHVMVNTTESVNARISAMLAQVERHLKQVGLPIDGIQDLFFYVLSQVDKEDEQKPGSGVKPTVDEVLERIRVKDDATKVRIREVIKYIQTNREVIESLNPYLKPIPFSFQTIVRSWDNLMAFTSKNFLQAKAIIETAAKRDSQNTPNEVLKYCLGAVIVLAGMVFVFKAMGWA
jgi:hypothetical protein